MLTVALGAGLVGGVLPAAAQAKTITLTLLNGLKIALPLPDGTPLDQLHLPALNSPVVSISLGNPASLPSSGAPVALPGVSSASTPTTLAAGPALPVLGGQQAQKVTGHTKAAGVKTTAGAPFGSPAIAPVAKPLATVFRAANGIPTVANPTLSLVPIGPIAIGVPNFFIDNFEIPPFLVPIYQAAGIEYGVPWPVLAAINQIETDYGRNLSVSTAGAMGWMQFLPATWKQYGVDGNGDGLKDPYNPVDAIFAAARFLKDAGASHDLRNAVFSYNHAAWYVDSVLLRAKLIGGLPPDLVNSITGLTNGMFPVHATARYADDAAETAALARGAGSQSAVGAKAVAAAQATNVYAKPGSPVVAVQDGTISAIGTSAKRGNYVDLRDAYGNTYYYSQLKTLASLYAEPKPRTATAAQVARDLSVPKDPTPQQPATAGHQPVAPVAPAAAVTTAQPTSSSVAHVATDTPSGPQRLLAHPGHARRSHVKSSGSVELSQYFTQNNGLKSGDVNLKPLVEGAHVVAGAILAHVGRVAQYQASHLKFQIRPAGKGTPLIDPKAILDGWKLLEATAIYRAAGTSPLGPGAKNPSIGQIFLESKDQLQRQVLADPSIDIYACGRHDIEAGLIDQRVLATLEFLSASGLKPGVSALRCGKTLAGTAFDKAGALSANASGTGVDISSINGTPITGRQGPGSIADIAIRQLLTLQGTFKPSSIVSLMSYPSTDNTVAVSDHADRITIEFATLYTPHSKFGQQVNSALRPRQWLSLINRLGQITNPSVAAQPSAVAIAVQP